MMLLRTSIFQSLRHPVSGTYACTGRPYIRSVILNGVLMALYFPIIFILFGVHVYLIHIDKAFPLMMTNGIVWWFLWTNIIGFIFFRRWFKKQHLAAGLTLSELGLSYQEDRFAMNAGQIVKTVGLAAILFFFAYIVEHTLESIFLVDYRFIFPFASDLTAYRVKLWFTYFPLLLVGFLLMGIFLHGQLRRPQQSTWWLTFITGSAQNILVIVTPLLVLLVFQYVPLFAIGTIPLVGPGGVFIAFTHNLFHIIGVLIIILPISTWFYQITGKIYLGAVLNAALVTWMFVSSQVIAPIPI